MGLFNFGMAPFWVVTGGNMLLVVASQEANQDVRINRAHASSGRGGR